MSKRFYVRKSEKSFTSELGTPLTVIGCPNGGGSLQNWIYNIFFGLKLLLWKHRYPQWLILELDCDKPGDFRGLSWLRPNILIMTAIGRTPSHIELFSDIGEYLTEKEYLLNAILRDGVVIYDADDEHSSILAGKTDVRKISCGIGGHAEIRGTDFKILYSSAKSGQIPTGMTFDIVFGQDSSRITIFQTIGAHNEYAALLSFAASRELGISSAEIADSLNRMIALPGRMRIVAGIKDTLILDDSYNSSPIAMDKALDVFSQLKVSGKTAKVGQKILVVGDMLELGRYSAEEHRKLAHKVKEFVDLAICVGIRSRLIVDELLNLGFDEAKIIQTDLSSEAGMELQKLIKEGDIILVKGSQAMRMERVVEEVMRYPQDKEKLLVRQEPEWLERE